MKITRPSAYVKRGWCRPNDRIAERADGMRCAPGDKEAAAWSILGALWKSKGMPAMPADENGDIRACTTLDELIMRRVLEYVAMRDRRTGGSISSWEAHTCKDQAEACMVLRIAEDMVFTEYRRRKLLPPAGRPARGPRHG